MIARLALVVTSIGLGVLLSAQEAASQPIVSHRITVLTRVPPYYTDPMLDPEASRTPDLSYPRLQAEVERLLDRDPRFELIRFGDLSLSGSEESLLADSIRVATGWRDQGIDYFAQYELQSANARLLDALDDYLDAHAYLTHPRDLATTHEYLARVNLELASAAVDGAAEPGRSRPQYVATARDHFRDMIRLNPASHTRIREGLFPAATVDQFREAYASLLFDDGRRLALTDSRELTTLLDEYGLEHVAYLFFIRDAEGVRAVLEVYDDEGRPSWHEVISIQHDDTEVSLDLVNRAVSRYLACVDVSYEPEPPAAPGDAGTVFINAGWGAGVYGIKPTDEQFFNQGLGMMLDYHLTDYLGFFGRANILFGRRDPEGDLLTSLTSTRLSGGLALSLRARWFRAFLGFGLELNFVSSYSATDEFWCKVSGGRFLSYGPGLDCLQGEVERQDAVTLVGPFLMPGFSFDVVGPFGLYVLGSFAFYARGGGGNIDFPVVGEAGIEYRF